MQKVIQSWLCHWLARPLAWAIYGIWLGIRHVCARSAQGFAWVRHRWAAWRARAKASGSTSIDLPLLAPPAARSRSRRRPA
jgi:hypothetical protein